MSEIKHNEEQPTTLQVGTARIDRMSEIDFLKHQIEQLRHIVKQLQIDIDALTKKVNSLFGE